MNFKMQMMHRGVGTTDKFQRKLFKNEIARRKL
jgi:hypothetical protein